MIDIVLTLFRETAKSKKLLFFLFAMIITTGYSYGKKAYLDYYKTEVTMAKFITVNCDGSLRFENKIFNIDIILDLEEKPKLHCIFNRKAWQSYEEAVLTWIGQNGGIGKYIYNVKINKKQNFVIFTKKYGEVYEALDSKNTLTKFVKNNYNY
jgi:hypothetical protein